MSAITDYATLRTAISDYLAREDLAAYIPTFIQNTEVRLYKMRIRALESALSGTISSGVLAVPADYVSLKYAKIDGAPVQFLERVTPEALYEQYPTRSGGCKPKLIAREADNFVFGPYPGDYTVSGIYYAKPDYLDIDTNPTNWFVDNEPSLLLYGALLEASPFLENDARIPVWEGFFTRARTELERSERNEMYSGSSLRTRVL